MVGPEHAQFVHPPSFDSGIEAAASECRLIFYSDFGAWSFRETPANASFAAEYEK